MLSDKGAILHSVTVKTLRDSQLLQEGCIDRTVKHSKCALVRLWTHAEIFDRDRWVAKGVCKIASRQHAEVVGDGGAVTML